MKTKRGDIWKCDGFKVIPTNRTIKPNCCAAMEAGLALQAAERYPELPKLYGERLLSQEKGRTFQI